MTTIAVALRNPRTAVALLLIIPLLTSKDILVADTQLTPSEIAGARIEQADKEAEEDKNEAALASYKAALEALGDSQGALERERRSLAQRGVARQLTVLERYDEARAGLTNALIHLGDTGRPSAIHGRLFGAFAWVEDEAAQWDPATEWYRRSMTEFEAAKAADSSEYLDLTSDFARFQYLGGDIRSAADLMQRVVRTEERQFPGGSEEADISRGMLARFLRELGDFVAAEDIALKTLASRSTRSGTNSEPVAASSVAIAQILQAKGDLPGAERWQTRAYETRKSLANPSPERLAESLNNLGYLAMRRGRHERAVDLYSSALGFLTNSGKAVRIQLAATLANRGEARAAMNRLADSEADLSAALDIRKAVYAPDNPDIANSRKKLGRLRRRQGDLAGAVEQAVAAVEIYQASNGADNPETAAMEMELAGLLMAAGRGDEALTHVRRALPTLHRTLDSVLAGSSERQRLLYRALYDTLAVPCAAGNAALIGDILARERGAVLDSLLEDAAAARNRDAENGAEDIARIRAIADRRIALERNPPAAGTARAAWTTRRESLRLEQERLEAGLARSGAAWRSSRLSTRTSHGDVRAALHKDQALVEYVDYVHPDGTGNRYGALVSLTDRPPVWVPLAGSAEIDASVGTLREAIEPARADRGLDSQFSEVATKLAAMLWKPVAKTLPAGCTNIVLIPDGRLHQLPFATLLLESGRFAGETLSFRLAGSSRDLLGVAAASQSPRALGIVGDVAFGPAEIPATVPEIVRGAASDASSRQSFPALPMSGREIEEVVNAAAKQKIPPPSIWRGAGASEEALRAAEMPDIVLFSTHGFFTPAPKNRPAAEGVEQGDAELENPMLRAGLVLAGANVAGKNFADPARDGLLTAQEIAGLDCSRTWLVVMTACDSGRGDSVSGEGVMGLWRGFRAAGARNVISSLWSVTDSADIPRFVGALTERTLRGEAPQAALHAVQARELQKARIAFGPRKAARLFGPFVAYGTGN